MIEPAAAFDAKAFVRSLPARPGVYRMLNSASEVIYVGKARSLRDRVGSYFHASNIAPKVQALVAQVAGIDVTVTNSEIEALLLEYNLIKERKPRYNVLMRDDKSYPYLHLDTRHEYPRIAYYRGPTHIPGRLFGPYPNAFAARQTLSQLQRLFRLRPCEDSYFANRSRPCLQYQIGRCSAPCVGLIGREDYAADVHTAVKVLEGRNAEVNQEIGARMEEASAALEYEKAAALRDQLAHLREVQAEQSVSSTRAEDADAVGIASEGGLHCVAILFIRAGRNLGTVHFFPKAPLDDASEVLRSFVEQYYLAHDPPPRIIVAHDSVEFAPLAATLGERHRRKVEISGGVRGLRARWRRMTNENAAQALRMRLSSTAGLDEQFVALAGALQLPEEPQRLECFDISHTGGEGTVASCVVFGRDGPIKSEYRRFNITGVAPGDDYGALGQAIRRRYTRVKAGEIPPPDVLMIDGGRGQIEAAQAALTALDLETNEAPKLVVGIAKGADRRAGQERLFLLAQQAPSILPADSPALHLIQRVRDEAHRFAITGHRKRRARRHQESVLDAVPGLGPVKRRELLKHFGGLHGVLRAGVEDFETVPGLGPQLARAVYEHLHPGE
ncbi:MAG TPA: excinuclease ABC subunit UvrC [Steroidobacteraceae bacterium]|nr:excinuclease ABC subunit UvrC [Steroidobacteraceae bacterium]